MAETSTLRTQCRKHGAGEFSLVVVMLGVLCILVIVVLLQGIPQRDDRLLKGAGPLTAEQITNYNDRMLAHRNNVLSLIITAFGAWVGAGAAYFFGKENLRVATDSMLQMRDPSPRERLSRTSIKQIPPTPIPPDWNVKKETPISTVKQQLTDQPDRWFIPILRDDGTLDTVVNEEAVWRYLVDLGAQLQQETVENLLKYIEDRAPLKRFKDIYVTVTMETTVGTANDLMDTRHVFLAIVVADRKPTHFFTTSEVRKLLLQEGISA